MTRLNRHRRTWALVVVALALMATGLVWAITLDGWATPRVPNDPAELEPDPHATPVVALQVVEGIARGSLGRPAHIVAADERVFVVDTLATRGVIKVFAFDGTFVTSFGTLASDGLAEIVDIALNAVGNVVVLDATPTLHVFTADGALEKRLDLTALAAELEVMWAKSVVATADHYYVLTLNRLLKLDLSGRLVTAYPTAGDATELGTAASEFYMGPSGLAVREGVVWVGDAVNGRLLGLGAGTKFDGVLTLPAVRGVAPYPTSLAVDALGNFIVVDSARQMLLALDYTGRLLAEHRLTTNEQLAKAEIADVAVSPGGEIFVSNALAGTVSRFELAAGRLRVSAVAVRSRAEFAYPLDVAITPTGMYVLAANPAVDGERQVWFRAAQGGELRRVLVGLSTNAVRLASGNGVLYVLEGDRVDVYSLEGEKLRTFGEALGEWAGFKQVNLFGEEQGPQAIYVDATGRVLVADTFNHRIVAFTALGEFLQEIPFTADVWPAALTLTADGQLLVLNTFGGQVLRLNAAGELLAVYASPGRGFGQLRVVEDRGLLGGPRDIIVAADGSFYVLDTYNSRILKFAHTGEPLYAVGSFGSEVGKLYLPTALAPAQEAGQVWVVDTYNHRLQLLQLR